MILDKQDQKNVAPSDRKEPVEAPPPYDPPNAPTPSTSTSASELPPNVPRSNYVTLDRPNGNIKGTWYIDPSLAIHHSLLPPIAPGESVRKNLKIYSHNGGVGAEVYILGDGKERALMDIGTKNGSVVVKLKERGDHPFHLNVFSHNGGITVYLPANFTGSVKHHTANGHVYFTSPLQQRHTPFSDIGGYGHCFIGDWVGLGYGTPDENDQMNEWTGDEVVVDTKNGSIGFRVVSEIGESSGGFFGSLFKKLY